MFQTFDVTSDGRQGPARLAALRALLPGLGVSILLTRWLKPRSEVIHEGESA